MSATAEVENATVEQQPTEAPAVEQPEKQEAEKKIAKEKKTKARKEKKAKASEPAKGKKTIVEKNEKPYVYFPGKKRNGKHKKRKNQKPSPQEVEAIYADLFGFGPEPWPAKLEEEEKKKNGKKKETWLKYMRQIHESQGFDIDDFPPGYKSASIVPYHRVGDEDDEWLNDQCRKALAKYNSVNGSHYEFVKVEKANLRPCGGFVIFLTFQARKPHTVSLVTFQARVYDAADPKSSEVQFCRLSKGPLEHNSAGQAPSPGPSECAEDSEDDEEWPPNTLISVFRGIKEKGLPFENGPPEPRARIDDFQHWFADDINEEMVLRQIRAGGIVGVLEFYPSLYKEFKGKGVYMGPTEQERRRREKKLQRDENYVVPGHSVFICGYNVDEETGEPYYIAKNSWGVKWADEGYGNIRRSLFYEFAFPCIEGLRVG